jgi:hypothetical protein
MLLLRVAVQRMARRSASTNTRSHLLGFWLAAVVVGVMSMAVVMLLMLLMLLGRPGQRRLSTMRPQARVAVAVGCKSWRCAAPSSSPTATANHRGIGARAWAHGVVRCNACAITCDHSCTVSQPRSRTAQYRRAPLIHLASAGATAAVLSTACSSRICCWCTCCAWHRRCVATPSTTRRLGRRPSTQRHVVTAA